MPNQTTDYYELLGVAPDATPEQIKRAHRELMKTHHPDRGGDEVTAKRLNEAKDVLLDPIKRAAVDLERNKPPGPVVAPPNEPDPNFFSATEFAKRVDETWVPVTRANPWLGLFLAVIDGVCTYQNELGRR